MKTLLCLLIIITFTAGTYSQEIDVSTYLTAIEAGDVAKAEAGLKKLKETNPDDPSVIYLDAKLTQDGRKAISIYDKVAEKFPHSRYADASLYNMYSYYYAAGLYNTAQKYLDKLKDNYKDSPYLKIIDAESKESIIAEKSGIKEEILNPAATEKSKKEETEAEKVYKFTLQAGAFLNHDNAMNLKNAFEKAGYYSELKEKKVAGSTFNIVMIGRFETEEEAKTFLIDLNKRQKIDARVVPID